MIYYFIQRLNHRWQVDWRTGLGKLILFFMLLEWALMLLLGLTFLL